MICATCGAENREGARFCDAAGRTEEGQEALAHARELADQKGSTAVVDRIDALLATQ